MCACKQLVLPSVVCVLPETSLAISRTWPGEAVGTSNSTEEDGRLCPQDWIENVSTPRECRRTYKVSGNQQLLTRAENVTALCVCTCLNWSKRDSPLLEQCHLEQNKIMYWSIQALVSKCLRYWPSINTHTRDTASSNSLLSPGARSVYMCQEVLETHHNLHFYRTRYFICRNVWASRGQMKMVRRNVSRSRGTSTLNMSLNVGRILSGGRQIV